MTASQRGHDTSVLPFSPHLQSRMEAGDVSLEAAEDYRQFLARVEAKFMHHPVITANSFCEWFAEGQIPRHDLQHFIVQFSVFSNLFLIAQLKKTINAGTLESMRASKEILANEIGVIFHKPERGNGHTRQFMTDEEKDLSGDPDLVSTEGTVDGGTFRFKAGHFEWLLRIGAQLGLGFDDMGKRRHGTPSTLFFCDELERLYGSEDLSVAEGASYAVENWAAAGFWKQLVQGLKALKQRELPDLSLAFFTWHDRVEDQHAAHTQDELEEVFFEEWFERDKFITGGLEMLEGVAAFWNGLDEDRRQSPAA